MIIKNIVKHVVILLSAIVLICSMPVQKAAATNVILNNDINNSDNFDTKMISDGTVYAQNDFPQTGLWCLIPIQYLIDFDASNGKAIIFHNVKDYINHTTDKYNPPETAEYKLSKFTQELYIDSERFKRAHKYTNLSTGFVRLDNERYSDFLFGTHETFTDSGMWASLLMGGDNKDPMVCFTNCSCIWIDQQNGISKTAYADLSNGSIVYFEHKQTYGYDPSSNTLAEYLWYPDEWKEAYPHECKNEGQLTREMKLYPFGNAYIAYSQFYDTFGNPSDADIDLLLRINDSCASPIIEQLSTINRPH